MTKAIEEACSPEEREGFGMRVVIAIGKKYEAEKDRADRLTTLLREVETYFAGPYDEHYQVDLWARISDELRSTTVQVNAVDD